MDRQTKHNAPLTIVKGGGGGVGGVGGGGGGGWRGGWRWGWGGQKKVKLLPLKTCSFTCIISVISSSIMIFRSGQVHLAYQGYFIILLTKVLSKPFTTGIPLSECLLSGKATLAPSALLNDDHFLKVRIFSSRNKLNHRSLKF